MGDERTDEPVDGAADVSSDPGAERQAAYVERLLAQAPPLTAEQRDRLSVLLRPAPEIGQRDVDRPTG